MKKSDNLHACNLFKSMLIISFFILLSVTIFSQPASGGTEYSYTEPYMITDNIDSWEIPVTASDENGSLYVLWDIYDAEVRYSRFYMVIWTDGEWSEPVVVTTADGMEIRGFYPSIAAGNGIVHLVFSKAYYEDDEFIETRIYYCSGIPASMSDPVNISSGFEKPAYWPFGTTINDSTKERFGNAKVVLDADGQPHVTWHSRYQYRGYSFIYYKKPGETPKIISENDDITHELSSSAMTVDNDGIVHVVWVKNDYGQGFLQYWKTGGTPVNITGAHYHWESSFFIYKDETEDTVHIVWDDDLGNDGPPIGYLKHTIISNENEAINDEYIISNQDEDMLHGDMAGAVDKDGNIHAVWYGSVEREINGEPVRVNGLLSSYWDGLSWYEPDIVTDYGNDDDWDQHAVPRMAVDSNGRIHIIWYQSKYVNYEDFPAIMYVEKTIGADNYITKAILELGGYGNEDGVYDEAYFQTYQTREHSSIYVPRSQVNKIDVAEYPRLHEWILHTPNQWASGYEADNHGGHDLFKLMKDEIASAESTVDIISLVMDKEILEGDDMLNFYGGLAQGIRALHDKFKAKGEGPIPLVRVITGFSLKVTLVDPLGQPLNVSKNIVLSCKKIYRMITSELPHGKRYVNVSVVQLFFDNTEKGFYLNGIKMPIPYAQWNHCKLLIRDRNYVITGGHNLKSYYLESDEPKWDLSVQLKGDVAEASARFFDMLYESARYTGWEDRLRITIPIPKIKIRADFLFEPWCSWSIFQRHVACWELPPVPEVKREPVEDPKHVFSLTRGFYLKGKDTKRSYVYDDSADKAILEAIKAARKSIYISQDMISWPYRLGRLNDIINTVEEYIEEHIGEHIDDAPSLIQKMFEILDKLNDTITEFIDENSEWPYFISEQVVKAIYTAALKDSVTEIVIIANDDKEPIPEAAFKAKGEKYMGNLGIDAETIYDVQEKIHFVTNLYNENHNKLILIDERAFYIGSQNLYPPSIITHKNDFISGLIFGATHEHGVLVENESLAKELKEEYFDRLLEMNNANEY